MNTTKNYSANHCVYNYDTVNKFIVHESMVTTSLPLKFWNDQVVGDSFVIDIEWEE